MLLLMCCVQFEIVCSYLHALLSFLPRFAHAVHRMNADLLSRM